MDQEARNPCFVYKLFSKIFGQFLPIVLLYLRYKLKIKTLLSVLVLIFGLFPSLLKNPEGGVQLSGLLPPACNHVTKPYLGILYTEFASMI
jgi:hypothetical protein